MWCVGYLTHLPGFNVPGSIAGPLLLGCMLTGSVAVGRAVGARAAWRVGTLSGVAAAVVNLLVLGAFLAEPPEDGAAGSSLRPGAGLLVLGFLALGAAIGAGGGWLGGALSRREGRSERQASDWLAMFGRVAALAIVPLLLSGGAVTSTESGLAVRDWPRTSGWNMLLYPIGLMTQPRIFLEHSHRLFGAMVGLTTLTLMVYTLVAERRARMKRLAVVIFLLVCVQGVIGGIRVTETNQAFALVHGVTAQVVFGLVVALAAFLSPTFKAPAQAGAASGDRRLRILATGLLHSLLMQLVLGAAFRHLGHPHMVYAHAAFSLVVVVFAVAGGFAGVARGAAGDAIGLILARTGRWIVGVVAVQFLLGWVTLWAVLSAPERGPVPRAHELATAPPVPVHEAMIATAHQANGALLLALAVLLLAWARRGGDGARPARGPEWPTTSGASRSERRATRRQVSAMSPNTC